MGQHILGPKFQEENGVPIHPITLPSFANNIYALHPKYSGTDTDSMLGGRQRDTYLLYELAHIQL